MRWVTEAMAWADAWLVYAWVVVGVALVLVLVALLRLRGLEVVVEVRPMRPGWKPGRIEDYPDEAPLVSMLREHPGGTADDGPRWWDRPNVRYTLWEYQRHSGRTARVRTDGMSEEE